MGLVEKVRSFRDSRHQKKIEKSIKVVKNAKAIKEERWAALSFLAEDAQGIELVIPGLLERFEYSLEHGIADSREKELALKGILRFESEAIPYIQERLSVTDRIAWPIKALKALADNDTVAKVLKSALNFEDVTFDQSAVDKNYDILCYLREFDLKGFFGEVAHFLKDPDERVRFAAAEALIDQKNPEVKTHLEPLLGDNSVENSRIKKSVEGFFKSNGWPLPDQQN